MDNPYDLIAEQWHRSRRAFQAGRDIDILLQGLRPGGKVLDTGCGTGNPMAEHLTEQGFGVVGVDSSEKMIEIARQVVPEAELIHGDMLDVEFGNGFAAAIAWDSVFHVERKYHQAIFRKLNEALESGGRLLLSIGGDGGEGFTSEMSGHTFFYSGYDPETALELLRAEGFDIELCEVDDPSSRGHIAVVAVRRHGIHMKFTDD